MIKIVFIGNGFHNRIKVLDTIENCNVEVINGVSEESIMEKLPNDVIDLFVVDRTKPLFRRIINIINSDATINHIPIISLITKRDLQSETINDGDLFVSEFVTDIEFKYYVKAMIKMKLMDDELKKETIVLELKVKERTKELERKIEEEYKLRQGVEEAEKKYRRIYDNVPDLIYTIDTTGKVLTVNNNVEYLGYTVDEIIGKNISYVLDAKNLQLAQSKINEKIDDPEKITKYTIEVKNKKGEKRILDIKSHHIKDETNKTDEIFAIARDVTDAFTAQKIIKSEQDRYYNMFDNMRSCVAVYKSEDNGESFIFTGWNKPAQRTEQVTEEEAIGKYIQEPFPDLDKTEFFRKLQHVYRTGESVYDEPFYYENSKTGVKGWRENFIYKLKSTDEVVAIYDDITERVEYQEKLEKAKELAEQSNKIKSVFISNMSHEIRTPMNSIIGFTSLLEHERNPKKFKNYIDIITNSGNLLITLIDDIMDLSKMESGNMKIKKSSFKLNKLLKDLKEQFKLELDKRDKGNVNIITGTKKQYEMYTDYKRINQVLNNLILNSIKFTNEGHIKYGYSVKKEHIEFYVEDTGIGIKEENLGRVFERFFQIDREKSKKQEGTGLGLTICKAIVELLGGRIWIESEFGIGTTVFFTIPIEEPVKQDLIEEKEEIVDSDVCNDKNVLVVEDNDVNYDLLKILLLSSKMNVDRAINHIEFFDKIESKEYDLILLDIQLPEFDGWYILDWIQENKKDIPVIVQTAFASIENEIKSLEKGAQAFFTKPINASSLLNKIKSICSNSQKHNS